MNSHPVLIVLAIAVAAPLLAEIPVDVRLPVVMLEGLLGWLGGSSGWRLCSSWRGRNSISNGFGAAL
jgi:hypothetical protein